MNKRERTKLHSMTDSLNDVMTTVENVKFFVEELVNGEEVKADNLDEHFEYSEKAEEMRENCDKLNDINDILDDVVSSLEDAIEALEEF